MSLAETFSIQHFVPSFVKEFVLAHAQPGKTPLSQRNESRFCPVVSNLASSGFWLEHLAMILDRRFAGEVEAVIRKAVP